MLSFTVLGFIQNGKLRIRSLRDEGLTSIVVSASLHSTITVSIINLIIIPTCHWLTIRHENSVAAVSNVVPYESFLRKAV